MTRKPFSTPDPELAPYSVNFAMFRLVIRCRHEHLFLALIRVETSIPCSRIQRRRARATSARCRSAACRLFFKRDFVAIQTSPKRVTAGKNTSLAQLCDALRQSQTPAGDQIEIGSATTSSGETLPPRGFGAALLLSCQRCTHFIAELTLTSKRSAVSRRDAPLQQLRLRVPVDHQNRTSASPTPRKEESMCAHLLTPNPFGNTADLNQAGTALVPTCSSRGRRGPKLHERLASFVKWRNPNRSDLRWCSSCEAQSNLTFAKSS